MILSRPDHSAVKLPAEPASSNDREGRERLARYVLRPPFALQRLSQGEDGRLVYRMKRPREGSLFLLLTPDELLARLATLVPPPRARALRAAGPRQGPSRGRNAATLLSAFQALVDPRRVGAGAAGAVSRPERSEDVVARCALPGVPPDGYRQALFGAFPPSWRLSLRPFVFRFFDVADFNALLPSLHL